MQLPDFQRDMSRLIEQFGKGAYSQARVQIIFREVGHLQAGTWTRIVDKFLGESRLPPMLPEIRDQVSRFRELEWDHEKKQNETDAKAFWANQIFDDEIKKSILQTILDRLNKRVSDADYDNFVTGLQRLVGQSRNISSDKQVSHV